jgi:thymidylate kinase
MEAKIIKTDGSVEVVKNDDKEASLEFLQKAVDGYIEIVWLDENTLMVVNEEGKLLNKPLNEIATQVFYEKTRRFNDCIVGNAVVLDKKYLR